MSKTIAIFVAAAVSAVAASPYTVASAAPAGGAFAIKNAAPITVENARWGGGWHGGGWHGGGWRGGGWRGGGWGWGVGGGLVAGAIIGGALAAPYYGGYYGGGPYVVDDGYYGDSGYYAEPGGGGGSGILHATIPELQSKYRTVYGQRWPSPSVSVGKPDANKKPRHDAGVFFSVPYDCHSQNLRRICTAGNHGRSNVVPVWARDRLNGRRASSGSLRRVRKSDRACAKWEGRVGWRGPWNSHWSTAPEASGSAR